MQNRIERLLGLLPEGIDAVLVASQVGRQYFTGMHSTAGTLFAVKNAGATFVIDFRYIEKARAVVRGAEVVLQDKLYEQIGELAKRHGVRRVAVESEYMTLSEFTAWKEKVPGVEFVMNGKVNDVIRRMRMIKSPDELDAIRAAQKVTDEAFSHICGYIRPGLTDREIAGELLDYAFRHGSEGASFDYIVVSGRNSSMPHGVPTDKVVARGDFITMDFGCLVDGYCSDMTRTVAVGEVTDEQRMIYDTVLRAQLAAIAAVKPGGICHVVDAAARDIITDAGYGACFGHTTGHSLGLEIHENPRFGKGDETVCEPGMVMTAEPGIYLEGRFGVRIEDMVLVTKDGCEDLTHSDKSLIIL